MVDLMASWMWLHVASVIWLWASITMLNYKLIFYVFNDTSSSCFCDLLRRLMAFHQCRQVACLLADSAKDVILHISKPYSPSRIMSRLSPVGAAGIYRYILKCLCVESKLGSGMHGQSCKSFVKEMMPSFLWLFLGCHSSDHRIEA